MKHCRPFGKGWQLHVRIKGTFHQSYRQIEPTPREVDDWVVTERALALGTVVSVNTPPSGPTFAEDVQTYLALVRSMPTYRWRQDDLALWRQIFGRHTRATITAPMVRQQLETWRAQGYAASTVNHRRTALMHLWTVLDGKSAPNPARDVPRYTEPSRPPAALSPRAVRAILDAMPDSQSKARLLVMAWTGWPQAQLSRLEPAHIAWRKAVYLDRRKGKGVPGTWLPLLPQAWAALRLFKKLGCWGAFSTSSMRAAFRRGAARALRTRLPKAVRAELHDVTPYQLRHSFGTLVAGITGDDRATQTLLLHADIRQTHRYTSATVDPRTAAALKTVRLATVATKHGVSRGRAVGKKSRKSRKP